MFYYSIKHHQTGTDSMFHFMILCCELSLQFKKSAFWSMFAMFGTATPNLSELRVRSHLLALGVDSKVWLIFHSFSAVFLFTWITLHYLSVSGVFVYIIWTWQFNVTKNCFLVQCHSSCSKAAWVRASHPNKKRRKENLRITIW